MSPYRSHVGRRVRTVRECCAGLDLAALYGNLSTSQTAGWAKDVIGNPVAPGGFVYRARDVDGGNLNLTAANALSTNTPALTAGLLDGRPGLAFAGGAKGLMQTVALAWTGMTVMVVGQFSGVSTSYRGIASAGPDTATDPGGTADGFYLARDDIPNVRLYRAVGTDQCIVGPLSVDTNPFLLFATLDHASGVGQLWLNPGDADATDTYSDVTTMDINRLCLARRPDSNFSSELNLFEFAIWSRAISPQTMQALADYYVGPMYPSVRNRW